MLLSDAGIARPASPGHIPNLVEDPTPSSAAGGNPAAVRQPAGGPETLNPKICDAAVSGRQPGGLPADGLHPGVPSGGGRAEAAEQGAAGAQAVPSQQPGQAKPKAYL